MENEKQLFKDGSKDRKHFTIIPNIIVNGYSATESGVYLYIKKRAGEDGQFFETAFNASKELEISKPYYLKILKKFIQEEKLEFIGWKKSKTHPIKIYEVMDIWKENTLNYEKKGKLKNLSSKRKVNQETLEESTRDTQKKNPLEEEPIVIVGKANEVVKEFNFNDYLKEIKSDKQKHIQIIGLYWQYKGFQFQNRQQGQAALKRELRPAQLLVGYSDEEITNTMDWLCENTDFKWTLESVGKFIDENLDELEPIRAKKWNK